MALLHRISLRSWSEPLTTILRDEMEGGPAAWWTSVWRRRALLLGLDRVDVYDRCLEADAAACGWPPRCWARSRCCRLRRGRGDGRRHWSPSWRARETSPPRTRACARRSVSMPRSRPTRASGGDVPTPTARPMCWYTCRVPGTRWCAGSAATCLFRPHQLQRQRPLRGFPLRGPGVFEGPGPHQQGDLVEVSRRLTTPTPLVDQVLPEESTRWLNADGPVPGTPSRLSPAPVTSIPHRGYCIVRSCAGVAEGTGSGAVTANGDLRGPFPGVTHPGAEAQAQPLCEHLDAQESGGGGGHGKWLSYQPGSAGVCEHAVDISASIRSSS